MSEIDDTPQDMRQDGSLAHHEAALREAIQFDLKTFSYLGVTVRAGVLRYLASELEKRR